MDYPHFWRCKSNDNDDFVLPGDEANWLARWGRRCPPVAKTERAVLQPDGAPDDGKGMLKAILDMVQERQDNGRIADELLFEFGALDDVVNAPPQRLMDISGIGHREAHALNLIASSVRHIVRGKVFRGTTFSVNSDLFDYVAVRLRHEPVVTAVVLYIDVAGRLVGDEEISRGWFDYIRLDAREIIRRCLELRVRSFLVAHNHPNGCPRPVQEDVTVAQRIEKYAEVFDLEFIDHVIVGDNQPVSLRGMGYLK